ncbi:MAG: hypothetical protein K6A38_02865 [Lachnospiraceae bacterium]|nr:hypothetical protein [Lachnospiraceae bacterium]
MKRINFKAFIIVFSVLFFFTMLIPVKTYAEQGKFDPAYYAALYPDVVNALGTDPNVLYEHYVTYGIKEGRIPFNGATPGQAVSGIASTSASTTLQVQAPQKFFNAVPLNKLANYNSIKKTMTKDEFRTTYDIALLIAAPFADKSREEQLVGVAAMIRAIADYGLTYSMDSPHYNDPYGYLVLGSASCAGCTRTTGLCLNILGIPYEHVNENKNAHQWCRVNINGTYWICDPFGLYVGPEPGPYQHPRL